MKLCKHVPISTQLIKWPKLIFALLFCYKLDTYTDAAADEYEEEGGEEIGRRGRQEGVVDECRGKSFAISGSDGGLIGGDPLDRPPASFLSQISDRDKARVEKILKSNADDPLPPARLVQLRALYTPPPHPHARQMQFFVIKKKIKVLQTYHILALILSVDLLEA